jgi:hypothetical protein
MSELIEQNNSLRDISREHYKIVRALGKNRKEEYARVVPGYTLPCLQDHFFEASLQYALMREQETLSVRALQSITDKHDAMNRRIQRSKSLRKAENVTGVVIPLATLAIAFWLNVRTLEEIQVTAPETTLSGKSTSFQVPRTFIPPERQPE